MSLNMNGYMHTDENNVKTGTTTRIETGHLAHYSTLTCIRSVVWLTLHFAVKHSFLGITSFVSGTSFISVNFSTFSHILQKPNLCPSLS